VRFALFRVMRNSTNSPTGGEKVTTQTTYLRRDPANVTPWAETCGAIRCLIEESDGAAGEVHHVEIQNAKLHYHKNTDEFYYIIDGQGTMILDEEEIELHRGVVVYVPRGVKHKAIGNLTVLTVCVPRGVLSDVHELE
jgi:mannose-6-phosphate isomerase-like protein (cupin superfamily)